MIRLKIALVIIGCVMAYFGYQEFTLSRYSSTEPVTVDMAEIEKGNLPTSNHVLIQEHVALFPLHVFSYSKSKYSNAAPNDSTSVRYVYYPVISKDNAFIKNLDQLIAKHGSMQNIPPEVPIPQITTAHLLVKTHKFDTVGQIPKSIDNVGSLQGLIINQIDSLDNDEANLVRQALPGVDVDKILILEEDRQPASFFKWFGLAGGGIGLCAIGLVWMFLPGKKA